jgi:HlyD family secretion protein
MKTTLKESDRDFIRRLGMATENGIKTGLNQSSADGRIVRRQKHSIRRVVAALVVLALIIGAAAWYFRRGNAQILPFRTAEVARGDLLVSISATGTVQPEEVVDVGAQVAGQILSVGNDVNGKTVDYGSAVENGTILATIDDSVYLADAAQAEAQVQSARATLQRAQADLDQLKAKFRQAERDWERARKLGPSEALAQASYDAYQSAHETAGANVEVGEATILQAKAGLTQAEAVFRRAQRNLGYCTIKSPVKGVIIDRRVNIGQTVVASLNAPSLFLIAKDLRRMQVWVAVNEADIGKIHPGQAVVFSVGAFPDEIFLGKVGKVRLNASMTQNVVTYTVEILTDNSSGRLLPYLTANVQFELDRRSDVLLAPNAALRWKPSADHIAPAFRQKIADRAGLKGRPPESPGYETNASGSAGAEAGRSVLWVPEGLYVKPIRVLLGVTDGISTEIQGEGLTEGMTIVTGIQVQTASQVNTSNPFTPKLPARGGRTR